MSEEITQEEITQVELLNMKLHEEKSISCKLYDLTVRRVFAGWIYTTVIWDNSNDTAASSSMCFVPDVITVKANVTNHY